MIFFQLIQKLREGLPKNTARGQMEIVWVNQFRIPMLLLALLSFPSPTTASICWQCLSFKGKRKLLCQRFMFKQTLCWQWILRFSWDEQWCFHRICGSLAWSVFLCCLNTAMLSWFYEGIFQKTFTWEFPWILYMFVEPDICQVGTIRNIKEKKINSSFVLKAFTTQ